MPECRRRALQTQRAEAGTRSSKIKEQVDSQEEEAGLERQVGRTHYTSLTIMERSLDFTCRCDKKSPQGVEISSLPLRRAVWVLGAGRGKTGDSRPVRRYCIAPEAAVCSRLMAAEAASACGPSEDRSRRACPAAEGSKAKRQLKKV